MRTICVVQARFGSSRLPGKALRPLAGRPMLAHVLERAAAIPGLDGVVLATSVDGSDDLVAEAAADLGVRVVRGPLADVLERMCLAAAMERADVVVRVTGDCPFLDPDIGGAVVRMQAATGGYAWNDTRCSGYPDGTDVEVFPMDLLVLANERARTAPEREHVTPWIRAHCDVATLMHSLCDYSWAKLSVDTPDDYRRAQLVAAHLTRGDFALESTMLAYRCGCV